MNNFNPIQTDPISLKNKLLNAMWYVVNHTFFRFTPSHFNIFRKYRVFLTRLFGAKIDWSVSLDPSAILDYPWNIEMHKKSSLGKNCWVYALDKVYIGEFSCVGKNVFLLGGSHDVNSCTFDQTIGQICIKECCWVATSAIVLPNIEIGKFSVVGAGAVVTKNVEDFSVVGGNPAVLLRKRILNKS